MYLTNSGMPMRWATSMVPISDEWAMMLGMLQYSVGCTQASVNWVPAT